MLESCCKDPAGPREMGAYLRIRSPLLYPAELRARGAKVTENNGVVKPRLPGPLYLGHANISLKSPKPCCNSAEILLGWTLTILFILAVTAAG